MRTGCIRAAATVWCAGALGGRGIAAVVAAVAAPQAAGGERGWGAASEAPVCLVTPRCSCGTGGTPTVSDALQVRCARLCTQHVLPLLCRSPEVRVDS